MALLTESVAAAVVGLVLVGFAVAVAVAVAVALAVAVFVLVAVKRAVLPPDVRAPRLPEAI
jgi:hypothetical protein